MNIDATDLDLLLYFLENGNATSTVCDVVKGLYGDVDRDDMIKKTNMLKYRINKWLKQKVFHVNSINGTKHYTIDMDSIWVGDCDIHLGENALQLGKALVFKMLDDSFFVHFIGSC